MGTRRFPNRFQRAGRRSSSPTSSNAKPCASASAWSTPTSRRSESDKQLIDWLRATGRSFAVVATKIDRLSGNTRTRNLAALKKSLEIETILPVSAKTSGGVNELWSAIESAASEG